MQHISFPSIAQFRQVVSTVQHHTRFAGLDEDGNAKYNNAKPLPSLKFKGTVKLHGTNAGVGSNAAGDFWVQSKENIITPLKDNAGFAMYVHGAQSVFDALIDAAKAITPLQDHQSLLVYGEWCGGNIQKNISLSQHPKLFVLFGIAVAEPDGTKAWFTEDQINTVYQAVPDAQAARVYNIYDFPTFELSIDFERAHESINTMCEITNQVEAECPVGKQLGSTAENGSTVGEGVVWKCVEPGYESSGFWCKVKGDKHAAKHKVTTLNPVDSERINAINQLCEQLTPAWRLEQMLQQTFDTLNGGTPSVEKTGAYIKAVMSDVMKEELDVIAAAGYTTKEITGPISRIARAYLMKELDEQAFCEAV